MKRSRNILLALLAFLGLGAIGGGIILIISPTGEMLGVPITEFKNIPFNSFLIPGIILFSVIGIVPLLLIVALLKKPDSKLAEKINLFKDMHWAWTYSIYIAFTLFGWIHIQLIFLQGVVHWLHSFYMLYAMVILLFALLPQVRNLYKKRNDFK
ncbi:MAG: hypothetical protein C0597_11745 [Marinilabiliales bacterium]|nr:MAG: hypothetical protein C0597_11745 [Marinilabiliales bacterium]